LGAKKDRGTGVSVFFPREKSSERQKIPLPRAPFFARAKHPKSSPSAFLCGNATQAIQWISVGKTNYAIRWSVIYLVDIAIHPLNNWGQGSVVR